MNRRQGILLLFVIAGLTVTSEGQGVISWEYVLGRWVPVYTARPTMFPRTERPTTLPPTRRPQSNPNPGGSVAAGADCSTVAGMKSRAFIRVGMRMLDYLRPDNIKMCLMGGDELINTNMAQTISGAPNRRYKRGVVNRDNFPNQLWPRGRIPFVIDSRFDSRYNNLIRDAMRRWSEKTCIDFVDAVPSDGNTRLNIQDSGTGCISFVGKADQQPQEVFLPSNQCFRDEEGTAIHELGHAIGVWHMDQRPNRDNYIRIADSNVKPEETGNFDTIPEIALDDHDTPYDFTSVMHWDAFAFSDNNQRVITTRDRLFQNTIGQRVELSYYDILVVNRAYNCQDRCNNPISCGIGHQNPRNCGECICPDGFSGPNCASLPQPVPSNLNCGGEVPASYNPQTIQSPSYPNRYPNNVECVWKITANPGSRIELSFTGSFGIYANDKESCFHWAEVKYKSDKANPGPRFCTTNRPTDTLMSEDNEVYVIFKSNYNPSSAGGLNGFQLRYMLSGNPCTPNPCQNQGRCETNPNSPTGYRCVCRPNYTGTNCESTVDRCPPNACNGQGTCRTNSLYPAGYYCECFSGYSVTAGGTQCVPNDPCNNYCQNGGRCQVRFIGGTRTPRCDCPAMYTGSRCETFSPPTTVLPRCPQNACSGRGNCRTSNNYPAGYYCDCFSGYRPTDGSSDCAPITTCDNNYCLNGGTCREVTLFIGTNTNQRRCECPPSYTGERCQNYNPGVPTQRDCSGSCGGGNLSPGGVTTDVCYSTPPVTNARAETTNCRWVLNPRTGDYSRECQTRQTQAQGDHYCCNGALNVTAQYYRGRRNVSLCVKTGWEPDFGNCPRRPYCGGCSTQTRPRWGIIIENGCKVFKKVERMRRACPSRVCDNCPSWKRICGQCAPPGECCETAVLQGDQCVPDGTTTRTNNNGYGNRGYNGPSPTDIPLTSTTEDPLLGLPFQGFPWEWDQL